MSDATIAVAQASDTEYAALCAGYNLRSTPSPAGAVRVRTVAETQEAVRYAVTAGLRVSVVATGHAYGRVGSLADTLLIRTAIEGPVVIDAERRTARVTAGTTWEAVVAAATPFGLLALHGSSPTVGVVGYLVNGGLGFAGRLHGVASNSLLGCEIVGADGTERWVDAAHEPELFWAVRGGGTGFGVITAVEIQLFPATAVYTGARFFPVDAAGALLRVWRDWSGTAPHRITTTARILNLPPMPFLPPPLTHGPVVCIDGGVVAATAADEASAAEIGRDLLDALSAVAAPVMDTWHLGSPTDMTLTHMDPPEPSPGWTGHDLLSGLPDSAIDAFVALSSAESPMLATELRQLGGAFAAPPVAGGAFDRVAEPFLTQVVAMAPVPPVLQRVVAHHTAIRAALAEWITPNGVPSFVDAASDARDGLTAEARARLAQVRTAADPSGIFAPA